MNIEDENFIKNINKNLSSLKNTKLTYKANNHNTFFIVAPPRGASMFFHQILVSFTRIGYISNLIASLWEYPELGVVLQKKYLKHNCFISNFKSHFGNTDGIFEPHEWGYFWRKWLDIPSRECYYNPNSSINWRELNKQLNKLKNIFELPIIFDTGYVNTYFREFFDYIDSAKYIFIFRSPYALCNSIFKARIKQFDNINSYYSSKPKNFYLIENIKNPIEQVVAQVYEITKAMLDFRSILNKQNYITLKYEDIFVSSEKIIENMISFTTKDFSLFENKKKKFKKHPVESFSSNFKNKNKVVFFDNNYKSEFDFYYKKYFGNFEYEKI